MAADDDKKLILARRARFIAAALAGVSVACGKDPAPPPEPCLSVPMDRRDAEPEPPPMPCLTPMRAEDVDAGTTDAGALDAGAIDSGTTTTKQLKTDGGGPTPQPTPCLSPPLPSNTAKPPVPLPCLSVVKPPDKKTQ